MNLLPRRLVVQPNDVRALRLAVAFVLSAALATLGLLLPVDRGFPTLRIAGLPFRWTFVVVTTSVCVLLVFDRRTILRTLSTQYCLRHAVVIIVLTAAALRSPLVLTAISRVLAYMTMFVLSFVVTRWIFERGNRRMFVTVVCCAAAAAAALGVVEGVASYRPAVYGEWVGNYEHADVLQPGFGSGYRVIGTLGNPIVYAMGMILCLPFVAEIRTRALRHAAVALVLAAAALTISKMLVLALLPMAFGYARKIRLRRALLWCCVLAVAAFAFQQALDLRPDANAIPLISRWSSRLHNAESTAMSVGFRISLAKRVIETAEDPVELLVGHGLVTESDVGGAIYSGLDTVDNTYLALFYEAGLIGLGAYLVAFGAPLYKFRRQARWNMHYWNVVSLMIASIAFVSYSYYTFNFVAVASLASLYSTGTDDRSARRRPLRPVRYGTGVLHEAAPDSAPRKMAQRSGPAGHPIP